jgi:hypothetical protein
MERRFGWTAGRARSKWWVDRGRLHVPAGGADDASMRRVVALAVVLTVFAACGGAGRKSGPNPAAYLTIVRHPLTGGTSASDAELLQTGRRACADLSAGMRSDDVVADIGGDPEPGSAAFNSAAIVLAAASRELCPANRL